MHGDVTNPGAPDAIPAATLVVMRDRDGAPPELLMVERAAVMAFAAGAMVFPGGRVDPGDVALAEVLGDDDVADVAARVAAIRETIEEVGLAIGFAAAPDAAGLARMRAALHAGTPFAEVLAAERAALDLTQLVPFARWRPAHRHTRIFDTRFYLARVPARAPAASVDGTENVRLTWATAQAVLDDADHGRLAVIFPTRRNLERLAQFASHEEAVAQARAIPQRVVIPWTETRDGQEFLCIPDDLGYPVSAEPAATALRG